MMWSEVLQECDDAERASRLRLAKGLVAMVLATYLLAYALSFACIESVMGTGVVLSVFGILAARASFRCGASAGVGVGALAVVLSLSLFVAVNAYGWSPRQAEAPFAIIGAVAAVAFAALSALALRALRALATEATPAPISTSTLLPVPERAQPSPEPLGSTRA